MQRLRIVVMIVCSFISCPNIRIDNSFCLASLASYTKLYSDRYASVGIRMNAILPGFIESWPVSESNLQAIPLHRAGTVQEIAHTAQFLIENEYITGQQIKVDGGLARGMH